MFWGCNQIVQFHIQYTSIKIIGKCKSHHLKKKGMGVGRGCLTLNKIESTTTEQNFLFLEEKVIHFSTNVEQK